VDCIWNNKWFFEEKKNIMRALFSSHVPCMCAVDQIKKKYKDIQSHVYMRTYMVPYHGAWAHFLALLIRGYSARKAQHHSTAASDILMSVFSLYCCCTNLHSTVMSFSVYTEFLTVPTIFFLSVPSRFKCL
jgi:hypothetical protein